MEDGVLKYLLAHGDFLIGTGIINADLMRFTKTNNSKRSRLLLITKKQINFTWVLSLLFMGSNNVKNKLSKSGTMFNASSEFSVKYQLIQWLLMEYQ